MGLGSGSIALGLRGGLEIADTLVKWPALAGIDPMSAFKPTV